MKRAVDLVRETQEMLGRRQVADTAMLALALSFVEVADDLAADIASPDSLRTRAIAESVRTCIASIVTEGIRGDTSGIDAIVDGTSRSICTRQLPLVDLVHLVAAVVLGAEEGLRSLLRAGVAPRRARDGPSSFERSSDASVRVVAEGGQVTASGSAGRSSLSTGAEPVIEGTGLTRPARTPAMTPDYEDP